MQRPLALRERCSSYCLPETCKCNVRRYGCRAVDHVRWRRLFHSSGCSPKHWNSRRGAVTLSFKGGATYLARVTSQLACPLAQLRGDVASPGYEIIRLHQRGRGLLYGASQAVQRDEAGRQRLGRRSSRRLLNWSQRLPANSRSCRPASRSKSECTIINTAPDTDPVWHVGRARLPFGTSRQSCCRFERTITHMPFARSSGGARIMSLDASSYSKVAAGLPTSTSIFGFGPRVQRMSDVGRFVPLVPLRCRRSP